MKWLLDLLSFWKRWEDSYDSVVTTIHAEPEATIQPVNTKPMTNQEAIYREAKVCLGYPQKLDPNVPNLVACASSLSGVLKKAGFAGLPVFGIASTDALNKFFATCVQLQVVTEPQAGDIIISPSNSSGAVLQHGHCGVVGNHGVMSNDSDTGLWREAWTLAKWNDYYHVYGKLPIIFYRWVGDKA